MFFVLFSSSIGLSYSQSINLLKDRDSLEYIYVYNYDTLVQVNYGFYDTRYIDKRKQLLILKGVPLDSNGLRYAKAPRIDKSILVGLGVDHNKEIKSLKYDFLNKRMEVKDEPSIQISGSLYPIGIEYKGDTLSRSIVNVKSGKAVGIADFSNILGVKYPPGIPEIIVGLVFINEDRLLVESAYRDGGYYLYRYFQIYNGAIHKQEFDKYRAKYEDISSDEYELFRIHFFFSHEEYDFLIGSIDYGNNPENSDIIFSKDFKEISYSLKKSKEWNVIGENIQDGKNSFFYIRSRLDNNDRVIVTYKLDKNFEEACYRLFKGDSIINEQVQNFGVDQLNILKNLLFAKHNYAFSSEFYQAYFNLFAFYSDPKMRSSRVKDVNKLLSKVDRDNLAIIMAELKEK